MEMFQKLRKFKQKKDNICARTGCNNQIKRIRNGTEFNYCSSSCQTSHYSPGSSEFYDESLDAPPYSSTSNQWGVWTPQNDAPPSYSSINNGNDIFGSIDDVQVTPLWETDDDPPSNTSNSRYSSSSKPKPVDDDFPIWLGSSVDPLWTPSNRNSTFKTYSPPDTPRSSSPSDEGEINCPKCTFFIRPNKTACEMCGTSINRPEPKRNKSSQKPKTTITSYRDLYEEEEEDDDNPFADPPRLRNIQSSYSSNNHRNSSSSKSQTRSSFSSSDNYDGYGKSSSKSRNQSYDYDDYEDQFYSQSRNQSSSRNRTSNDYISRQPTPPPIDKLWIDDQEDFFESIPTRKSSRQRPKTARPYATPSFFREQEHPKRNMQKPPTPPLSEVDDKDKPITCSACNFNNHNSMSHCEICFTQLNKNPERDNKRSTTFNRIEQTKVKKACPVCSFYNDFDRAQCEMCYSAVETARRSIFTLPSFFSHDVNKTQCPSCTFMNHPSMVQCEVCQNVLPGSNIIEQQQQYQQYVDNMPGPATKLIRLQVDSHDYMTVQHSFKNGQGVPNANILAIFKVIMPAMLINAHETYKKQVAGNNSVANVTHRMFHGTHVACDAKRFYGPPGWKYCTAANCGLCGISQNGNSCAKSKHGGRMWFADNSATSLGYCRTDQIKAMFVQDIIHATKQQIIIVDKEAATLVKFLIIFQ